MRWWIMPGKQSVAIDNQLVNNVDLSSIPPDVFMVEWRDSGQGEIERYGNGLRESFDDPSPYAPIINQFLAGAPNLGLAQAQKVQNDMIGAISNSKKSAPFHHPVAAGDFSWDATDTATMHASMIPAIQSVSSKANEISAMTNYNFPQVDVAGVDFENQVNNNIVAPNQSLAGDVSSGGGLSPASISNVVNWKQLLNHGQIPPVTQPTSSWTPVGSSTPVNVTSAEAAAIITGIAARQTSLSATTNTKVNAVNALTSVSDVIAYDVTVGW